MDAEEKEEKEEEEEDDDDDEGGSGEEKQKEDSQEVDGEKEGNKEENKGGIEAVDAIAIAPGPQSNEGESGGKNSEELDVSHVSFCGDALVRSRSDFERARKSTAEALRLRHRRAVLLKCASSSCAIYSTRQRQWLALRPCATLTMLQPSFSATG